MKPPSERSLLWAAMAALLLCLVVPISNPDLFWHLSAARRMVALRTIPSADWLSWSMSGARWIDFEWLAELIYGVLHHAFGMAGLWTLKILLVSAAAWVFWKTLKLYGVAAPYRATALAFWSAASLTRSDLRPEWFSVIAFGALFWQLEARRLGRRVPGPGWVVPLFCVWANLHAGFAYGLLLIGFYAIGETLPKIRRLQIKTEDNPGPGPSAWLYLAAALGGTLLQPFGFSLYAVLWSHWVKLGLLQSYIAEWGGIRLRTVWHWPYWILLFVSFGLALRYILRKHKTPLGPLLGLLYYAQSAFKYRRLAAYDVTLALPFSGYLAVASETLPDPQSPRARWSCLGVVLLCLLLECFHARAMGTFHQVYNDEYAPVFAERFLEREKATLASRVLYNDQSGWGGYLGYKLYPDYRIFQDGRYIFHPLLKEAADAVEDSDSWAKFMDRRKIDVAVMENVPRMMDMIRVYPDGSSRDFLRPYYVAYLPKTKWALVFWDDKALIFVRRGSVPRDWLNRHEFKYALPHDREARDNAVRRHEISREAVRSEFLRHALEIAELAVNS